MKRKKDKNPNKDWLDWWLSDDAPPPEFADRMKLPDLPPDEIEPAVDVVPKKDDLPAIDPGTKNITINVNMPTIDLSKLKVKVKQPNYTWLKKVPQKDSGRLAILAVGMMLVGLAAHSFIFKPATPATASVTSGSHVLAANTNIVSNNASPTQSISLSPTTTTNSVGSASGTNTSAVSASGAKASFKPLAPLGKPDLGQYAFAKTSYNSTTGVYTYIDIMNGSPISVSEQEPKGYKNAQDAVTQLAKTINATQPITTNAGTGYIYTDPTSGKQAIIAPASGLVISINSQATHINDLWVAYLNNLL